MQGYVRSRTIAPLVIALLALPVALLAAPVARAQTGEWSGTLQASESISGVGAVSGGGKWSFSIGANGQLSGQSSFQLSGALPPPPSGCTQSLSTLTASEQATWTGTVQGDTATINIVGTLDGPSSETITCTAPGASPVTYPVNFPFPMPINAQSTIDLSELQSGTPYTITSGGATETLTMTSGPSTSTSTSTGTSTTSTSSTPSTSAASTASYVTSGVTVMPPGGVGAVPVTNGTQIQPGSKICTGVRDKAILMWNDGAEVVLGPLSCVTTPLAAPNPIAALWRGIVHVIESYEDRFKITIPVAVLAVRGTEFTLQVLSDNSTFLQVFEGSVAITDDVTNATVVLSANQQVTIPNVPGGVSQQNLTASVEQFNPNQVNQWWIVPSSQTNSTQTSSTQPSSTQTNSNSPPAQIINLQAGQSESEGLPGCANMVLQGSGSQSGVELQAQATGEAAGWVTPSSMDFGYLEPGACSQRSYRVSVPTNTAAGTYPLTWLFACPEGNGSVTCGEGSYDADVVVGVSVANDYVIGAVALIAIVAIVALVLVRRGNQKSVASEHGVNPPGTMTVPKAEAQPQIQMEVSTETLDKLTKIKTLLDSGAISAEEYEKLKKSILHAVDFPAHDRA